MTLKLLKCDFCGREFKQWAACNRHFLKFLDTFDRLAGNLLATANQYRKKLAHCILCGHKITGIERAVDFCLDNLAPEQVDHMQQLGIEFGIVCCNCYYSKLEDIISNGGE